MSVACLVLVLLGFARTYYLKSILPMPSFPLLFHLHGVLFTAWMILLVVQAWLVASGRTARHRRVGRIGLLLMAGMLITGTLVSIAGARGQGPPGTAVRRGELAWVRVGIPPLDMLFGSLAAMVLFGAYAGAGLAWRRRPETHKRLMALATIVLLPPAIGRGTITLLGFFHPALFFVSTGLFVLARGMYDRRSRGRVHPVTLWGGLALMVSFPVRLALGRTDLWLNFAAWLIA